MLKENVKKPQVSNQKDQLEKPLFPSSNREIKHEVNVNLKQTLRHWIQVQCLVHHVFHFPLDSGLQKSSNLVTKKKKQQFSNYISIYIVECFWIEISEKKKYTSLCDTLLVWYLARVKIWSKRYTFQSTRGVRFTEIWGSDTEFCPNKENATAPWLQNHQLHGKETNQPQI